MSGISVLANTSLKNSNDTITVNPISGSKTITSIAASLFAGSLVLANRKKMVVRNEDPSNRFRVGPSGVTQQSGFPIEPGGTAEFTFDPTTAISIYAISEGAAIVAQVIEL